MAGSPPAVPMRSGVVVGLIKMEPIAPRCSQTASESDLFQVSSNKVPHILLHSSVATFSKISSSALLTCHARWRKPQILDSAGRLAFSPSRSSAFLPLDAAGW